MVGRDGFGGGTDFTRPCSDRDALETTDFESHLGTLRSDDATPLGRGARASPVGFNLRSTLKMRLKGFRPPHWHLFDLLAQTRRRCHRRVRTRRLQDHFAADAALPQRPAQGTRSWTPWHGSRRAIALLAATATVLASCATSSPYTSVDWSGFIASFPGQTSSPDGYASGAVKVAGSANVAASIAAGNERFDAWCSAHGGKSGLTQVLTGTSAAVSKFHTALSAKVNTERSQGLEWVQTSAAACIEPQGSRDVIALMLSEPGRRSEAQQIQGKVVDKLTRTFFDRLQADEFSSVQLKREAERAQRQAADSRDREDRHAAATLRLRQQPRVGDRTLLGVVIELRAPMALVQYDERYRQLGNRSATEWVRIDTLSAPSDY